MVNKLPIIEQDFITPRGKKLDGKERIVNCPMWLCKSNVKKTCGKCKNKVKIEKEHVLCKYERNF